MSKQKSGATQAGSLWRADPMGMWRVNQDALLIVAREGGRPARRCFSATAVDVRFEDR
jgi:hypothetical protein